MLRKAPRRVGLEHTILQDVVLRVRPVVGDLARVVVAHDVRLVGVGAVRVDRLYTFLLATLRLGDESVHPAAIDVGSRVLAAMRPAPGSITGVVIGTQTAPGQWVGHANRELTTLVRQAVGAGGGAEVLVEATVLLHAHDHVLDLLDADARLHRRWRHRLLRAATGDSDDED